MRPLCSLELSALRSKGGLGKEQGLQAGSLGVALCSDRALGWGRAHPEKLFHGGRLGGCVRERILEPLPAFIGRGASTRCLCPA